MRDDVLVRLDHTRTVLCPETLQIGVLFLPNVMIGVDDLRQRYDPVNLRGLRIRAYAPR